MKAHRTTRRTFMLAGASCTLAALEAGCHVNAKGAGAEPPQSPPSPRAQEAKRMTRPGVVQATFTGGREGPWRVTGMSAIRGDALSAVSRVAVLAGLAETPAQGNDSWALRGVTSHARYVERSEKARLDSQSPPLARPEATLAVLIPIRKSPAWWALPQDERRAIFEARSHHIADSMAYLPRIARRLYHSRDLGEPFDFLTWFEMAPEHRGAFDDLVGMLRSREEWTFVEREVEIRLERTVG